MLVADRFIGPRYFVFGLEYISGEIPDFPCSFPYPVVELQLGFWDMVSLRSDLLNRSRIRQHRERLCESRAQAPIIEIP